MDTLIEWFGSIQLRWRNTGGYGYIALNNTPQYPGGTKICVKAVPSFALLGAPSSTRTITKHAIVALLNMC